jgi:hypothetical protein
MEKFATCCFYTIFLQPNISMPGKMLIFYTEKISNSRSGQKKGQENTPARPGPGTVGLLVNTG